MWSNSNLARLWPHSPFQGRETVDAGVSHAGTPDATDYPGGAQVSVRAAHVVGMDATTTPIFLTPAQMADCLQISIRTLEDWRLRGYGPPFLPVGKHVRYPLDGFEAWVAAGIKGAA